MKDSKKEACMACAGSGKCSKCGGKGNVVYNDPTPIAVVSGAVIDKTGSPRMCSRCSGSGICQVCKGSGNA